MGMKRGGKQKVKTPFVYARESFGVWTVFIDGVCLKGDGFGGYAEFSSEEKALEAGRVAGPQPSPWK